MHRDPHDTTDAREGPDDQPDTLAGGEFHEQLIEAQDDADDDIERQGDHVPER
ncbi:hypothetical protein R8Z57_04535 [Microbacterium sp. M3]|uniref:Uncharacterized protein n=1 Tax=Microbacterium arthrosphaerae TaxID=792652 RepID=A0ABU4GY97_9MICO|nr:MULTISPECIES: hypothetical protein [Microbacterium]MDW4572041.1 hypothetical protein [Microbacterium arthrosphaerae]MDW7605896.1 hypothetical protein [Microbacterium sp. M3]